MVTINESKYLPNKWLILFWHHFCYYKRHPFYLIVTLLLPFCFLGCFEFGAYKIFAHDAEFSVSVRPDDGGPHCLHQSAPFLSAGLLHFSSLFDCRRRMEQQTTRGSDSNSKCVPPENYVEGSLSMESPEKAYCRNSASFNKRIYCPCNRSMDDSFIFSELIDGGCKVFQAPILYYPNTSNLVLKIMAEVRRQLHEYEQLMEEGSKMNFSNLNSPVHGEYLAHFRKLAKCFSSAKDRVKAFRTYDEMVKYIRDFDKKGKNGVNSSREYIWDYSSRERIWGVLNFGAVRDSASRFEYNIQNFHYFSDYEKHDLWLQDLVETSYIKVKTNSNKLPISVLWKPMPYKCGIGDERLRSKVWEYFHSLFLLLPVVLVIGFLFCPITFLSQVLTEKELKLREYLSVMGVGDMQVKISWILFFMLLLVPLSIAAGLQISFGLQGVFKTSDASIFIMQLLLFSIGQMTFSYFLSSVLRTNRRVTLILGFINIFFSLIVAVLFMVHGQKLPGRWADGMRVISLHCSTPFVLSMMYAICLQVFDNGAKWKYFFDSVQDEDNYYGFGEGILWMIGDIFLYVFLAWYFQHVTPGEQGIRYKPYFLFQPSFWCPKYFGGKDNAKIGQQQSLKYDMESVSENAQQREAVVVLDQLTKYYDKKTCGADRISLTFRRGEIAALLGQNGAGKSTTLNTVMGILSPTSGNIYVCGIDTRMNIEEARRKIGFVPQYNVLYPSLTVMEHLIFFGWLKGMTTAQINEYANPLLTQLGLDAMRKQISTKLSGGQKRKLSILLAYLGNPDVVILDEPTTGVDPFSRRAVWDLILRNRQNTATILSTHFMEEADLLSDRLAIIDKATVRAVGSPNYIKNKYGKGFRVTVACEHTSDAIEKATAFFQQTVPGCSVMQATGRDLMFNIPKDFARSDNMVHLLQTIEETGPAIGISTFGVSEPTLEEAFFEAACIDVSTEKNITSDQPDEVPQQKSSEITYEKYTGPRLFFYQLKHLLKKRFLLTWRNPVGLLVQMIMPLTFIGIVFMIGGQQSGSNDISVRPVHIYQRFRSGSLNNQPKPIFFFQDKSGKRKNHMLETLLQNGLGPRCPDGMITLRCKGKRDRKEIEKFVVKPVKLDQGLKMPCLNSCNRQYCDAGKALDVSNMVTPSDDLFYVPPNDTDLLHWIITAAQKDKKIVGGFQYFDMDGGRTESISYLNGNSSAALTDEVRFLNKLIRNFTSKNYVVVYTMSGNYTDSMLNAFNNLLLQTLTNDSRLSIHLNIQQTPMPSDDEKDQPKSNVFIKMFASIFFIAFAFIFATFGMAVGVQYEKGADLKSLQLVSGANPFAYWAANVIWDYTQFLIILSVMMILLATVENTVQDTLGQLTLIALPFGFAALHFIYLLSFVFKSVSAVNFTIFGIAFVCFNVAGFTDLIFSRDYHPDEPDATFNPTTAGTIVRILFHIIPYYGLGDLVTSLIMKKFGAKMQELDKKKYEMAFKKFEGSIIEDYILCIVYFLVLMFLEYFRHLCCRPGASRAQLVLPQRNPNIPVDPDVLAEEQRVLAQGAVEDPVVVQCVTKKYRNLPQPAVDAVSFGIPRSQCFGLLGVNGAGKSTLFNILAGFQPASHGRATIENMDVAAAKFELAKNISYCPQEYVLFDSLTCTEHLELFGSFRGIPPAAMKMIIPALLKEVDLAKETGKKVKGLSGGTKRKLQFAISLLDYKPVMFLDEPTSGMDPGSRRRAWNCIKEAVSKNCSVVLTSHSMEECEALCHRIVIMVKGRIQCMGSIQYLKDKLGNRYTAQVKLTTEGRSKMEEIKTYLAQNLAAARLVEEHANMLQYEIEVVQGFRLSTLFAMLLACQKQFPGSVEDFTVSQITLENIFVSMATKEEADAAAAAAQVAAAAAAAQAAQQNVMPTQAVPMQNVATTQVETQV